MPESEALNLKKSARSRSHELVPIVNRDVAGQAVQGSKCSSLQGSAFSWAVTPYIRLLFGIILRLEVQHNVGA